MTHTVAEFKIPYYQILNAELKLVAPLPEFTKNPDTLIDLYYQMVRGRVFDKKAITLQRTGKMGTYAPIHGQEAIGTAIGHALKKDDVLIPYYRDYCAQFQRGVKIVDILTYWGGDERGNNFSSENKDLPICVPIASQCLHATGVAFALKYRKQPNVALVCLGDGGTSEGDFYEAINVAGVWQLPLVFVVNNNHWAISVPLEQQTACQTLAQKAIAAGFNGIVVDGNDILALRECIGDAIESARAGKGPTLIEARTYRLSDHTTADDATRYQEKSAVETATHQEPLRRFRHFLHEQGLWNEAKEKELYERCQQEVQDAVDEYLNRPPQPVTSIFDYHYSTLPNYLIEQRAIAIEEANNA